MTLVQQVVDLFFVHLQIATVDSVLLATQIRLLLDQLVQQLNRARHNTFILARLDDCLRHAIFAGLIFVALHRVRFSRASLAISKNR